MSSSHPQPPAIDYSDHWAGAKAIVDSCDGITPDDSKPSEVAGLLLEIIRRIIRPSNACASAQRFIGLCLILCPDVLNLTQRKAAQQMRLTRASLSKQTIELAQEFSLGHSRWRKSATAARRYSAAQRRAYERGTHTAHQVRHRNRPAVN